MATEAEFKTNKYNALLKELKHNRTASVIKNKNPDVKFVSYDPKTELFLAGNKKNHKLISVRGGKDDIDIAEQVHKGMSDDTLSTPVYHRRIIGNASVKKIYPNYDYTWYGVDQYYGVKAGRVHEIGINTDGSPNSIYFHGVHGWGDDYWDKYIVSHNNGVDVNGYTVTTNPEHFRLDGLKAADIINSELIINYIKNRKDLKVVNAFDSVRCVALFKTANNSATYNKATYVLQNGMTIFLWKENGAKRRFVTEYTRTNIPRTEVVYAGTGDVSYDAEKTNELFHAFKYPGITSRRQTVYCADFDVTSLDYRLSKTARYGSPFTTLEVKDSANPTQNKHYFCLVPETTFANYKGESVLKDNGTTVNSIITEWETANETYAYSDPAKSEVFTLHEDENDGFVEFDAASVDEEE